jgi:hypothetical protein
MIKFVYEAISSGVISAAGKSLIMAKDKYHDAVKKRLKMQAGKSLMIRTRFLLAKANCRLIWAQNA